MFVCGDFLMPQFLCRYGNSYANQGCGTWYVDGRCDDSYVDDDGRFVSEDYGFCRYWQKIDGKVWVDPGIEIGHLGRMTYEGSMIDYLVEISDETTKANARALAQPKSKKQSEKSKKK